MNRVLTRPMFRRGGSTSGITSGLRRGYEEGLGVHDPKILAKIEAGQKKKQPSDFALAGLKGMTISEIRQMAKAMSYRPRGTNVYDFMTGMGLNLVSQPAQGNIWQQVAKASKEPYEKFLTGKGRAAEQEYASEADMFKTLIGAQATMIGTDAKSYAHRDKAELIRKNIEDQIALRGELATLDLDTADGVTRSNEIKDEIKILKKVINDPEFSKAMLKFIQNDQEMRTLKSMVKNQIANEMGVAPDTDFAENPEFYNAYTKRMTDILGDYAIGIAPVFREYDKEGGRAGYQMGQSVMGNAVPAAPTAMPTAATTQTMPEELGRITYEELRARLPQEIGDEIVRLLANSAEALEDFATIQTEQDIANFNKKYGVNLVLPSEG